MHLHLPKPLHGWRAFVGEVGIIVIGVLIALGAEQMVSALHDRTEARDAERAIRAELEQNMAKLRSRREKLSCVVARLNELMAVIDSAGVAGVSSNTHSCVGCTQFYTNTMVRW